MPLEAQTDAVPPNALVQLGMSLRNFGDVPSISLYGGFEPIWGTLTTLKTVAQCEPSGIVRPKMLGRRGLHLIILVTGASARAA